VISKWYPHVASTIALVVALTMGGAYAANNLIGSKQIKNGSIKSIDLANNSVRSADIASGQVKAADIGKGQVKAASIGADQVTAAAIAPNQVGTEQIAPKAVSSAEIAAGAVGTGQLQDGSVTSEDIGDGEVGPDDVTLPAPVTLSIPAGEATSARSTDDYRQLLVVGRYVKQVADSAIQVTWTGSAASGWNSGCVFQLRVDGQPSGGGTGETFVGSGVLSLSSTALFTRVPTGEHTIEIWVRLIGQTEPLYNCTVGPSSAQIGQTVVVAEQVS